jgi:MFS superfamily sulfate permease-like transporter
MPKIDYERFYHIAIMVNCITVIHSCVNQMHRTQDRAIFCAATLLTVFRLAMDIAFRHMPGLYLSVLGLFVGLELIMLDCIMRKMHKMTTSPSIVVLFLSLCMLMADISYGLHFMQLATPEMQTPLSHE